MIYSVTNYEFIKTVKTYKEGLHYPEAIFYIACKKDIAAPPDARNLPNGPYTQDGTAHG